MAQKYETKPNTGALFRNTDKTPGDDKDRDYSGTIKVGDTEYWISGWIKKSAAGNTYMSLAIKPKDALPIQKGPAAFDGMVEDIPF